MVQIKRKKVRRGVKTPYQKAKEKLVKVFSVYIRLRDSDENGIGRCITCKKPKYWKEADNGHFQKRQFLATTFDEQNCNLQCKGCNNWLQGNDSVYAVEIDKKWGKGTADKLRMKVADGKRYGVKFYEFELLEKIKYYEQKIKELGHG